MVAVAVTAVSSEACIALAAEHAGVHASVGIQPNYVHEVTASDWDRIVELSSAPGVIALGETGLDRYWDDSPFDMQQDYFDRHLDSHSIQNCRSSSTCATAKRTSWSCCDNAATRGLLSGVMHSFTGTADMAAECVALGLHISFAGMVTYKKSDELRAVAATVPLNRLLIETDSPYLSPEPVRKIRRNQPAHVVHTASLPLPPAACPIEQMAMQTNANANNFFALPSLFNAGRSWSCRGAVGSIVALPERAQVAFADPRVHRIEERLARASALVTCVRVVAGWRQPVRNSSRARPARRGGR